MHLEGAKLPESSYQRMAYSETAAFPGQEERTGELAEKNRMPVRKSADKSLESSNYQGMTKELEAIFERTYGKIDTDRRNKYETKQFSMERQKTVQEKKPVVISRITSYNVCYTKLLRLY